MPEDVDVHEVFKTNTRPNMPFPVSCACDMMNISESRPQTVLGLPFAKPVPLCLANLIQARLALTQLVSAGSIADTEPLWKLHSAAESTGRT